MTFLFIALQGGRFDLIALDHYMPARDGLDILPEIRALAEAPPVIYVTGAQDGRLAVAALKAGAADYVIKDVSSDFPAMLRAAAEQALAAERLRRDKAAADLAVREARDRAETLLREVNHRVGNSLQLVSSFVALQARMLTDEAAKAALSDTQARIEAVAQVHRRLYTSDDVERVELSAYLDDLLHQLGQLLRRALRRQFGVTAGNRIVIGAQIVRACPDLGVDWLTVYAFSTENWKRSTEEVLGLMGIFARYIRREADAMSAEGVRMRFRLPWRGGRFMHSDEQVTRVQPPAGGAALVAWRYDSSLARWGLLRSERVQTLRQLPNGDTAYATEEVFHGPAASLVPVRWVQAGFEAQARAMRDHLSPT